MIRKKLYILISGILIIFLGGLYLSVDLRSTREKFTGYLEKEKFEKIIGLVRSLKNPSDEELFYASVASSRLGKRNKAKVEDPFILKMRKGSYFHSRAILEKLKNTARINTGVENARLMEAVFAIDARPFLEEFSEIIPEALNYDPPPLSANAKNDFLGLIHFLASKEESGFRGRLFNSKGINVNVRSGPGVENKTLFKIPKEEFLFLTDRDQRQETISGHSGNWVKIYRIADNSSGWVFSAFLTETAYDSRLADEYSLKFTGKNSEESWDFASWDPTSIPSGFSGEYIRTEMAAIDGESGFVIHGNSGGREKKICRTQSGRAASINFSYMFLSGKEKVNLFELNYQGESGAVSAFRVDADSESIFVNENRYVIGSDRKKEHFTIRAYKMKSESILVRLLSGEETVLGGIESYPLGPEKINLDRMQWELCIREPEKRSKNNAAIFGFKFME
ncbi:MAG: SH3 domain-containing protein [Leptospira sp.]|nr:SH3 domain-containing protein [Leptospira sp.]